MWSKITPMAPTALAAAFLTIASVSTLVEDCFAFVPLPSMPQSINIHVGKEASMSRRNLFDFLKQDDKEEKAAEETEMEDDNQRASSDDPVDKIFSFFFGEKEESPMGMKRFGMGEFSGE
jgi:hypothetical protein